MNTVLTFERDFEREVLRETVVYEVCCTGFFVKCVHEGLLFNNKILLRFND